MKIATFNIENLDNTADDRNPSLEVRAPILRESLNRLDADILCLQEVHGQELPEHTSQNPKRNFSALDTVLEGTRYANYQRAFTVTADNQPYDKRNLVILADPTHNLIEFDQHRNSEIEVLQYRKVTSVPPEENAKDITWERPILHAQIDTPSMGKLHVLNVHLKSRLASNVAGQKDGFQWNSAAGWAEGYFLSSIKRVGQALELRVLLDKIFDEEPDAKILACGDFNAEPGEVPIEAICGRVENTDNAELRDRVMIPCSRAVAESIRYTHLHHGEGNLLDHILVSPSLLTHFRNADIHNENLHDESLPFRFETKFPEADHAPFLAEFE